jgi:hypothetical protein
VRPGSLNRDFRLAAATRRAPSTVLSLAPDFSTVLNFETSTAADHPHTLEVPGLQRKPVVRGGMATPAEQQAVGCEWPVIRPELRSPEISRAAVFPECVDDLIAIGADERRHIARNPNLKCPE